jgi:NADH dehydrogenase [ubiquinone] 1 alpha subcomplex assembly factor 7
MSEAPLSEVFKRLIATTGPISLMHFMGESNARYYSDRDALGAEGDFITAPEISQMFGELVGLWLADLWIRAERPEQVHYVELGPGRGYLARDAQRAMKLHGLEPRMHLVEGSTRLRDVQLTQVPDAIFHHDLSTVPSDGPLLIVANEFLDALPVRQLVMTEEGWREIMVDVAGDGFAFAAGRQPMDAAVSEARRDAELGTVLETCPGAAAQMFEVSGRLASQGGAALFIDYGHAEPRFGSTLQAVRAHRKLDPLTAPGEADLTAHVDFDQMKQIVLSRGVQWMGTVTQGAWLAALGINQRAEALARSAPHQAKVLASARERLIAPDQMGELFKVMGLAAPDWPIGAGFVSAA